MKVSISAIVLETLWPLAMDAMESRADGAMRNSAGRQTDLVFCFDTLADRMKLRLQELTPKLWPTLEKLFGSNGACGGCWCMSWRTEKGEGLEKIKGAEAKKRFKKLVTTGKAHGALAFDGDKPVGWASFDRRKDFLRLDRAPSLACDDSEKVWSVPCFFIHKDYRSKGVATELLKFVCKIAKKRGAKILEGYPSVLRPKQKLPAPFVWTGTVPLFEYVGFRPADHRTHGKVRMRKISSA